MKYKLLKDLGTGKKGEIFEQGLHGVPDSQYKRGERGVDEWFWKVGVKKEEHAFFHQNAISQEYFVMVE